MNETLGQKQLIEQYSDYVIRIAKQIKRTLSPNIDTDDLIGYGMTGLIEAAQRFDPSHGANFTTFSYYRIRGAIYDGLRVMGTLSRTEYKRQQFGEKASAYLESENARQNYSDKRINRSEETINQLAQKVQRLVTIYVTSMEEKDLHSIADNSKESALDRVARLELYQKMQAALGKLSKNDQKIINAYYFEDKSLEEVGKSMGLSKSWTCRKHARAMEKLSDIFFELIKDKPSA